ncbi:cytochrome c oxidase subunit 5b-1, mitochondrial-like isoform X2 [Diospyros lotus]|uniref:cytochrome c oxidase subunit 5b-1, mitochondrial-like isoform X2 n=1 Tax=Diospyros lotus TaxID=55363 RepID=UPI00224F9E74|nr:cytochrome c oxidase subunit 5b-1, mitochondrial-like isoform X2 [Diospyros lotus]
MWRRLLYNSQLRTLRSRRSASTVNRFASFDVSYSPPPSRRSIALISRHFSSDSESVGSKKRVEDVMPIATGHEREELEAELEGRELLDVNYPVGPFGTKESPAVIKSYYDKRIVGCPGGEGEDEHDVVWFWLEKGKPHECPVCSQYFVLEVVGPGGPPDGHGDDEHH